MLHGALVVHAKKARSLIRQTLTRAGAAGVAAERGFGRQGVPDLRRHHHRNPRARDGRRRRGRRHGRHGRLLGFPLGFTRRVPVRPLAIHTPGAGGDSWALMSTLPPWPLCCIRFGVQAVFGSVLWERDATGLLLCVPRVGLPCRGSHRRARRKGRRLVMGQQECSMRLTSMALLHSDVEGGAGHAGDVQVLNA